MSSRSASGSDGASVGDDSAGSESAEAYYGSSSRGDEWRIVLGLILLVISFLLRVEVVRFTLRLASRVFQSMQVWIKEFEKNLLRPLSWVVFVLLAWGSFYTMTLASLLSVDNDMIDSATKILLGIPLVWTVVCLCNYITWGIVRWKGWNRAANKDDDDYSRAMIITEGISVIKVLLVVTVVSTFMVNEIGQISKYNSSDISTVAVLVVELVVLLGGHSWLKNIMGGLMAMLDEQLRSGLHVRFKGHEGVVERIYLQSFSLRKYDKSLVYIPNGLLLENALEVRTKMLDRKCIVSIHLHHGTTSSQIRDIIQTLDNNLNQWQHGQLTKRKSTALALDTRPQGGWDLFRVYEQSRLAQNKRSNHGSSTGFWVSVVAPYIVHVVYFSQERHIKQFLNEKTSTVLEVLDVLETNGINVQEVGHSSSPLDRPRLPVSASGVPSREVDEDARSDTTQYTSERIPSESLYRSGVRRRRQQSAGEEG